MQRGKTEMQKNQTRRRFLQAAGVSAASLAVVGRCFAQGPAAKATLKLGLASYTLRKFTLAETLAMTQRVGLKYICLKSFHLPLVNRMVKKYDVEVAIHNHGPGDKTYPTPESAYERIKTLDKRIGLCIDVGHTLRVGADPIRDAERFADRLLDVHLKDTSEASPKGRAVEVGRGVIDIPRFLKTLLKIDYAGVASFEYEKDAADPLAGLAESVDYVKGVLAAI